MFANVGLTNAFFFKKKLELKPAFCDLEVNRYLWLCLVLTMSFQVFFLRHVAQWKARLTRFPGVHNLVKTSRVLL